MGKKISDEIKEKIPILYSEFSSKAKVAEILGISVQTVTKYLTIYEAAPFSEAKNKEKVKVTDEMVKKINEMYPKCRNMNEIARELGISNTAVRNHLSEENVKLREKQYDDRDALYYYIIRLFGVNSEEYPVSGWNLTQMSRFKAQGISYKAQLLTLKYFYEIKKNSTKKSNNSIGIIPFVFDESKYYYENKVKDMEETNKAIERQLEQDRITIKYKPNYSIKKKKKKKLIDLNSVGE